MENRLDSLIRKEEEKINQLNEKKAEIEERRAGINVKIKEATANLDNLLMKRNQEKLMALSKELDQRSITIDEVLAAITNGKIAELGKKTETSEE
ncbi:MAG: hypothetical protein PHI19_00100 [Clostridia bacterium]|jgi:hypothetical protein|nr:hypothetical protein [Clostridia bacterium]